MPIIQNQWKDDINLAEKIKMKKTINKSIKIEKQFSVDVEKSKKLSTILNSTRHIIKKFFCQRKWKFTL